MLRKCENTSFLIRRISCVGATIAIAVAIEESVNIDEYFIAIAVAIEESVNIDEYFIAISLQLH